MKVMLILLFIPSIVFASSKGMRQVAVIDSGFDKQMATYKTTTSLCKTGHFDFTTNTPNIGYDEYGHGSFVSSLIVEESKRNDICVVIYKVNVSTEELYRKQISKALIYAYNQGVRVVNISLGQEDKSIIEEKVIRKVTANGMKLFIAAGNEHKDLNVNCNTYPACSKVNNDNLYVVGAKDASGLIENYSNRGLRVQIYELGTIPGIGRGTSFAAPRALARYLRERSK